MTTKTVDGIIKSLCRENRVTFYDTADLEHSSCVGNIRFGNAEIFIGKYKNQGVRLFCFLHELGHVKNKTNDLMCTFEREFNAWDYAIRKLKELKIKITMKMVSHMLWGLGTYSGNPENFYFPDEKYNA